jgi:PEP-CTERM motif
VGFDGGNGGYGGGGGGGDDGGGSGGGYSGGGSTLGGAGGGSYSADLSNVALTAGENTGNGEVVINVISLVPEPSTFALIGGTLGLLALARRKNAG